MEEILLVPTKEYMGGKVFGFSGPRAREITRPIVVLRERLSALGYELKTIDQSTDISKAKAVVFSEMPTWRSKYYKLCLEQKLRDRMYVIAMEPHVIHPPNHDPKMHGNLKGFLTWNDDLVDNRKYFKFHYTIPIMAGEKIAVPRAKFSEKKLLCLISSNKWSSGRNELYSERIRAIRFMERNHPGEFDLYGPSWDLPIIHLGTASDLMVNAAITKFWPKLPRFLRFRQYPSHRGMAGEKRAVYPKYKFTIAYENQLDGNGYITEKIFEALLYGCVPVYLGDAGIKKLVPKGCFIDKREHPTYKSLYSRIASIGEKEHIEYIDNAEKFLNGKGIYPFTIDAFVENFKRMLGI